VPPGIAPTDDPRRALTRDRVGANDAKRLQYQIHIGGRFFHPGLIKILNVVRHVLAKLL